MNVDDVIFINQIAQGIVEASEGLRWFAAFDVESRKAVLREISTMILQAHPAPGDAASAIVASGLKGTLTPCVLLSKPNIKIQLAKVINLPDQELTNVLKLLVRLLGIADKRRRETKPIDLVNHWWHRDLKNPQVLAEIRKQYGSLRADGNQ